MSSDCLALFGFNGGNKVLRAWICFLFVSGFAGAQTATTTSLVSSPNPANVGHAVTLTATVTSGATGKVTFYDHTTILGVSAISGGQAAWSTVLLPSGARSLRAYYGGDSDHAPSSSASVAETVRALPSLGLQAPVSSLTGLNPYSAVMGDFNGDGKQDLAVSNLGNQSISILLGTGNGGFQTPINYYGLPGPSYLATADFNGDGKPDLAVTTDGPSFQLFLGNGDGNFQPAQFISLGTLAVYVAAGDFNGDGKADLVFSGNGVALILLGKGDGTFQAPVNYTLPSIAYSIAVGDFNGDGIADLAFGTSNISILIGQGNGTFQLSTANYPFGTGASSLVAADLNGDGKLDLVGVNPNGAGVLLGNGDGTFQSPLMITNLPNLRSLAVGDINGDGYQDLVTFSTVTGEILYGKGDGSFQQPIAFAAPFTYTLLVGDFNGDGFTDIAGFDLEGQSVSVFLGGAFTDLAISVNHGDGLTQGQVGAAYNITVSNVATLASAGSVSVVDALPVSLTATAIAGTGWTCDLATLTCTRSDPLAPRASYPVIEITVNVPSGLTGNVTNSAIVSGGGDANLSNNTATDTTASRLPTTIALSASPNPSTLGQTATLTASVTAGATGKVTFYDQTTVLGIATITGGQATLATNLLSPGSHSLTSRYDGGPNYGPSLSPARTLSVSARMLNGYQPRSSYPVPSPYALAIGDFNRDGKPDMVTVNSQTGGISVLLGNGDGTLQAAVNFSLGFSTYSVAIQVGDFNGDGIPDVVVNSTSAYTGPYGFFVFLGKGDGTFLTPIQSATGVPYYDFLVADFNGDGKLDIAATTGTGVALFVGNGDGTFQSPATIATSLQNLSKLLVADFNLDGKPDLIASNYGSALVLLGNGDGTFQAGQTYALESLGTQAIAVGDFNGDGKPDLVEVTSGGVEVFLGNGDGTFLAPIVGNTAGTSSSVMTGDFNGDGRMDIAYQGYYNDTVAIALGNGDGTFQPAIVLPTDGYSTGNEPNVILADFNGDGVPDLAVANFSSSTVNVFLGGQFSGLGISMTHNGPLTAGQIKTYSITVTNPALATTSSTVTVTDTPPFGLSATAMTGTGWNCILAARTCTNANSLSFGASFSPISLTVTAAATLSPSTVTNTAYVTYGTVTNSVGDPTLIVSPTTTSVSASPDPAVLGQAVTLTATVSSGAGTVLFLADGNGLGVATLSGNLANLNTGLIPAGVHKITATYLGDAMHGASTSPAFSLAVRASPASSLIAGAKLTTGTGPMTVLVGDLNGDGKADLITANGTANNVSVFFGNGDGTFRSKADYAVGLQPAGAAIADFNGDGKPDIAVSNENSNGISVLLNKGDGTFAVGATLTMSGPQSVIAADLNGDGKLDLAAIGYNSRASIFFGVGDGTFQPGPVTINACCSSGFVAGDFNGDGKTDLVVGSYVDLNNGDGSFGFSSAAGEDYGYASGDLNGDGKADLVGADKAGIYIFLGNGDGTFQPPVTYTTDSAPASVTLADTNGDGKLDVIVANGSSNTISVFLGNGDGSFRPAVSYNVGTNPQSVVAGDFNGDGRTDLAVANSGDNTITILLGAKYVPSPAPATVTYSITGNGKQDLSVYYPGLGGYQYSLLSAGNGTYTSVPTAGIGAFDTVLQADFNGDAKSDMLFYSTTTGAFKIGLGDGTGHFTYTSSNISPGYNVIARGDFNHDGKTDLLLYRQSDGAAYVGLSNGDGTFNFLSQTFSPGFTTVAVADYNGDGISDVILYNNQTPPYVAYYLPGDGTGHFGSGSSLFFGPGYSVYPADLNADGKSDFILYRPADGTVFVAIGNGTSFTYHYLLYSPGFTSFKIGDVNGDGFPDLVLYNNVNANGYLLLGDGAGNFPTGFSLFFGPGMDFVDLRDFNGDGKQDVLLYRTADGTSFTGLSNGSGFSYTYNYFGPGRIVAQ